MTLQPYRLLLCSLLVLPPFPASAGTAVTAEKAPRACQGKASCAKPVLPDPAYSSLLPNAVRSLPKIFRTA